MLPKLTIGKVLFAKMVRDFDEYNSVRLEQLRHRPLPDLEEIDEFFKDEWLKWQGTPFQDGTTAAWNAA